MESEKDRHGAVRREFLWRFSKHRVGASDLDWAEEHLPDLESMSVDPAIPYLRHVWEYLASNVWHLALQLPSLRPMAAAVGQRCERHRLANEKVLAAQDEFLRACDEAGATPVLVKGAAARAVLDAPPAMNDTDFVVTSLEDCWSTVGAAESLGYELKKLKVRRSAQLVPLLGSPYHGYGNMYRREGGGSYVQGDWDLDRVRTLDLHLGTFYGPGEGVLLKDLRERSTRRAIGDATAAVPCIEDLLLVELVHFVRHGTLAIRNLNRVALMLVADPPIDLRYVAHACDANALTGIAFAVALAIAANYGAEERERAEELLALLPPLSPSTRWCAHGVANLRHAGRYGGGTARSVALQARYVADTRPGSRGGPAVVDALVSATRLYSGRRVYPRAHGRSSRRRVGWIERDGDSVMLARLDGEAIPASWIEAAHAPSAVSVSPHTVVADRGGPTEVVLTPVGAFSASPYSGSLTEPVAAACRRRAMQIRAELEARPAGLVGRSDDGTRVMVPVAEGANT